MPNQSGSGRTDTASRVIKASPHEIYQAFVDPEALISWLPPSGMSGRIDAFDARDGGTYRMSLTYLDPGHASSGKFSENTDVVQGTFLKLIPNERIVQQVEFESDDPAFAGIMTMTWALAAASGGTEVTIICENVPSGIRKEDHDMGLNSSLGNLAAFVES
ncbi:SRPBCC family protein [Cohnella soli]|uniref:SRPBCC family protein n=1 Tax=Cohnella soli TaxID=425005 RepID=A0ABW0HQL9_9BACL